MTEQSAVIPVLDSAASTLPRCARVSRRVLVLAGRREALWLARSPLVLAGLAISCWLIWLNNRILNRPVAYYGLPTPPEWWVSDVSIVACLLPLAGAVLLAAQLAAGRARRDAMEQLYASFPAPASLRTGGLLVGVAGPVLIALLATGGALAWVSSLGAIGSPRLWVLAAGLLLVILAGCAGAALGAWLRHPMAGILTVLVLGLIEIDLVLSWANPVHLPGGVAWLFPWSDPGVLLNSLPGITVPFPPALHLAELAGLTGLAVVAALWQVLSNRRLAIAIAVACLAVTCWSAWSQAQPVSPSVLTTMVRQVTQPAAHQSCQRKGAVRYCYYPAFAPLVRQWAIPVNGVLAVAPSTAAHVLTVRQVWDADFMVQPLLPPTGLTSILSVQSPAAAKLATFQQKLSSDAALIPGSSVPPVYTDGNWGTGASLPTAQFALAMSTAEWVTGLPTTGRSVSYDNSYGSGDEVLACVPVNQARAAIALWLAASATPATRAAFAATLVGAPASTEVGKTWLATISESGSGSLTGLTATIQQARLAAAMLRLPAPRVESVLGPRWVHWLRPQTTTADLAASLGLPLPPQPVAKPQLPYTKGNVSYGSYTPPAQACA